ncbi:MULTISPECIES: hypothetical protein [unclassified Bradyrhizobium]|uniref:hypothetical protein n=1 Tax=unclassified Bradyrhizobium TaxID=2631580 RepID=UPI00211F4530|nr:MULTISPECIES: hypothetical protein [unclassified Bradyrhizobium]MDD1533702.1 hypothetical protein [Bradyrhizobium sp. WBOS8]MDD1584609.1 hypothetical protein [Bradyrhizobium sp. WBOS4]UUO47859.1 hypothetical protein DCM78_13585 [Bradyrhizobium sp. WBOS04]UUO61541.1 hypothetical protein DCM80_21720 [Bradyrhizobium sp. WBOS08]
MKSFLQSDAPEAKSSKFRHLKQGNFKTRTAALAIVTFGAVTLSIVLASAATTFDDPHAEGASGAAVQKRLGRCKAPTLPPPFAM